MKGLLGILVAVVCMIGCDLEQGADPIAQHVCAPSGAWDVTWDWGDDNACGVDGITERTVLVEAIDGELFVEWTDWAGSVEGYTVCGDGTCELVMVGTTEGDGLFVVASNEVTLEGDAMAGDGVVVVRGFVDCDTAVAVTGVRR